MSAYDIEVGEPSDPEDSESDGAGGYTDNLPIEPDEGEEGGSSPYMDPTPLLPTVKRTKTARAFHILTRSSSSNSPKEDNSDSEDDEDDDDAKAPQSIELERDWNAEFQALLCMPESTEKYENLSALSKDFVYAAKTYGKIIISEKYLPNEKKTIKPLSDVGGIAGGIKYRAQGILFKFAVDAEMRPGLWLYGINKRSDHWAAKAANIELKSLISYYNTKDVAPLLNYPLQALIDYRGFRLIACSWLPLEKGSIKYGSSDAGRTVHNEIEELNIEMMNAGKHLNLAGHKCGKVKPTTLYTCCDIEAHVGRDKRYYVLDFARVFPTEHFPNGNRQVHGNYQLYRRMRAEFVKTNEEPLNSDALSAFSTDPEERKLGDQLVASAGERLHKIVIPQMATFLTSMRAYELDAASFGICDEMHRRGINIRHLGNLRACITDRRFVFQRQFLLLEIIARVAKNLLNQQMRDKMEQIKTPSTEPYVAVGVDFLNTLIRSSDEWTNPDKLKKEINFHFENALSVDELSPSHDLRTDLDTFKVIARIQQLTGLKLLKQSEEQLHKNINKIRILKSDIQNLSVKVKHIHLVDFATARMLSIQAEAAINESNLEQAERLCKLADEAYRAAHASNTNNPDILHYWALCLLQQSRLSPVAGKTLLDSATKLLKLCTKVQPNNPDILISAARVNVDLGATARFDEQSECFHEAERWIRSLISFGKKQHKVILAEAELRYKELPQYLPQPLDPSALEFAFVNVVSTLQNPKTKQDIAKVAARFSVCVQWQKFALMVKPEPLILGRMAETLRRWGLYLHQECAGSPESMELLARASQMLELSLRFGGTFLTSKHQIKITPLTKKSSAGSSSKHSKTDHVGTATKSASSHKATASDIVVGLAAKSTGRLAPSSILAPSIIPTEATATSNKSTGARFSIQGFGSVPQEINFDASGSRIPFYVRNAFNIKELTMSLGLFVDGAEAPIKVQPNRPLCFGFESDWSACRVTGIRIVCSASGSRLDVSANATEATGKVALIIFREIPENQHWAAYKDMSISAMQAAAASMKHHVEVLSWGVKSGELTLPTPAFGRTGMLKIDVTSEVYIRQIAMIGSCEVDESAVSASSSISIDHSFSYSTADPYQLASLLQMGKYSKLVDEVTSYVLRGANEEVRDRRKIAFSPELNSAIRPDIRRYSSSYLETGNDLTDDLDIFYARGSSLAPTNYVVERLMKSFSSIWMLDLSYTTIEDDTLRVITRAAGVTLVSLNLKGCNKLGSGIMEFLPKSCPQLEHLALFEDISELALLKIGTFSYRLESLDISQCKNISDKFWKALSAKRHLNLSGCAGTFTKKAVLKWAKEFGSKLHSLSISNEYLVLENKSDLGEEPFLRKLVDDDFVTELLKYCCNLVYLDASFCEITDRAVIEIGNKAPKLETLFLKYNSKINEAAVANVLMSLTSLKVFSMRGQRGSMSHVNLTSMALGPLVSGPARPITRLYLARCIRGDGKHLASVLDSCRATLTVLDLVLCDINDSVATSISKCSELLELQLQGCSSVTTPVVESILRNCTKLCRVGLSGCKITDASMKVLLTDNLAKQGRGIHSLLLGGCDVTDATINYLCQEPHSKTVSLLDVKKTSLTGTALLQLGRSCSRLQMLDVSGCADLEEYYKDQFTQLLPHCILKGKAE